ncbi:MAG: hypothetical protein A3J30_01615 [Candidatus Wildermuthbacteria bacterium RIFCSPLOWO2_02_FULL_47_9c]|uniref:Ribosomal RNA large subunit methyltransferase E n=2 Tax=Parcubacteria group TaxID=1794811 RepID=A0A837ILY7_9BACT|nr:MAG: Ribosomal RNA large subunit methyltransferase E [Candidatus Yanofskybacteria bacterium GW2011_GWC1_48_11]KKW04010.1 MAG: Ribosomal RNA large subunit methyltransferase E [Parcubacteria group bacterium GW2011_GWB1_49_12]KKW08889.1 MAG: Ribosomal RNA large subunit methyltransferase E [Parcubacteria group bacterium GW2011_GWA1_49_26]KKW13744.1 MAG: Ribosomal RNA large subunit methyltransferase E [Parcubacteria group bacterium GW2011_GWA2_50_10]OHA61809.1 MAG: hypothetical protein A2109_0049
MVYIPHDKFARKARQEGYRARSAYKLLDLQRKFGLIKRRDRVLDLGAAPGSWMQVAAQFVGDKGKVVGIDLAPIQPLGSANAAAFQKDIGEEDFIGFLEKQGFKAFDVVLSDVAPNTTGIKERDQALSHELSSRAFEIAIRLLNKYGAMVVKVFEGPDTPELIKEAERHFSSVKLIKPEASTKGSKEFYIVAQGFKGPDR